MDHEAAFAKAFLISEKRARFVQFLSDRRRRAEMLGRLGHHLPYLSEFATAVPSHQDFPAELEKMLICKGAEPTCYVMVDGLKAGGRELPLRQALDLICLHEYGAILSCIPGRLAYYKPESPGQGMILERSQP